MHPSSSWLAALAVVGVLAAPQHTPPASSPSSPPPRYSPAFAIEPESRQVTLFGGHSDRDLADSWVRDEEGWRRLEIDGPSVRNWPQLAPCPDGGLFLFGGDVHLAAKGDSWRFDGRRWSEVNGAGPPARSLHRLALDGARKRVVLFGGRDRDEWRQDTWEFDGKAWSAPKLAGEPPPARQLHAMAWDGAHRVALLFGGTARHSGRPKQTDLLGDTWEYDGKRWSQLEVEGPSPRDHVAMAFDAKRGVVVLFGGGDPERGALGDTWIWDGADWSEAKTESPGPRAGHSMAWDPASERVLLFGGFDPRGPRSDLLAWDGEKWSAVE